jgi:hypothetical protein
MVSPLGTMSLANIVVVAPVLVDMFSEETTVLVAEISATVSHAPVTCTVSWRTQPSFNCHH